MKSELIVRKYKMNRDTTVEIRSKKAKDADIYTNSIVVTQVSVSTEPLKIGTRAEIMSAVKEIELEDDQLGLSLGQ